MIMVRPFQLVFDQHPAIGLDVLAENVGAERADRALLASSSRSIIPSVWPRISRFSLRASHGVKSDASESQISRSSTLSRRPRFLFVIPPSPVAHRRARASPRLGELLQRRGPTPRLALEDQAYLFAGQSAIGRVLAPQQRQRFLVQGKPIFYSFSSSADKQGRSLPDSSPKIVATDCVSVLVEYEERLTQTGKSLMCVR